MTNDNEKQNMRGYDSLGLVEQLQSNDADKIYTLGAMEALGDELTEGDLRDTYRKQLRSTDAASGLEHAIKTYSEKYMISRHETTLKDFCDIYSVDEFTRKSVEKHAGETIGDLEKKYTSLKEMVNSKTDNFTKEQIEKAKKDIEEYEIVMGKIKLVEDKRYTELKINAIDRTKKIMQEQEAEQLAKVA
jgi:hypothetical protein